MPCEFLLSVFIFDVFRFESCTLSAPIRVAATKLLENDCCFSFRRVVVIAGGDDDDCLLSRHHAICTHVFTFDFRSFNHARFVV